MADIAKVVRPTIVAVTPPIFLPALPIVAGEAIAVGDSIYIKSSDGKWWRSTGAANDANAASWGIALDDYEVGEVVKDYARPGCLLRYGSGLTPGARYYVSATAGAIADAASTGGLLPVARALTPQVIEYLGYSK